MKIKASYLKKVIREAIQQELGQPGLKLMIDPMEVLDYLNGENTHGIINSSLNDVDKAKKIRAIFDTLIRSIPNGPSFHSKDGTGIQWEELNKKLHEVRNKFLNSATPDSFQAYDNFVRELSDMVP